MKAFLLILLLASALFADKKVIIKVEQMHCPLCTTAVKKALKATPGVKKAKVRLNTKEATVISEDDVSDETLLKSVATTGYTGKIISSGGL